jgi:hypothetical protein
LEGAGQPENSIDDDGRERLGEEYILVFIFTISFVGPG